VIELAFIGALQASADPCAQVLTVPQGEDSLTLTGVVGRDLRHNYLWISDFGCGADRQILLVFRYSDIRAEADGLRAIEAIEKMEMEAIRQGRLVVPDTGLRVRAVGQVSQDSILRQLNVERLELLEDAQ
jgi:hypothetical protein